MEEWGDGMIGWWVGRIGIRIVSSLHEFIISGLHPMGAYWKPLCADEL